MVIELSISFSLTPLGNVAHNYSLTNHSPLLSMSTLRPAIAKLFLVESGSPLSEVTLLGSRMRNVPHSMPYEECVVQAVWTRAPC